MMLPPPTVVSLVQSAELGLSLACDKARNRECTRLRMLDRAALDTGILPSILGHSATTVVLPRAAHPGKI